MESTDFDKNDYHRILCPDVPDFLHTYTRLSLLQRLSGVGLLCGTDWTPLFHNRFFYSRLDHSIGTALIVWNFTHDKKQTLAGLMHDISAPAFSHVIDFRNGDTATQESTEEPTRRMINEDMDLSTLLFSHGIYKYEIDNYHLYPVADNELPGLNADRLEYMYPSGAALDGIWTMDQISRNYSQVTVLKNERSEDELGFLSMEAAREYTEKFLETSMILQKNEDKLSMQLLADVVARALECGYIMEEDLYTLEEDYIIRKFDSIAERKLDEKFTRLYKTFRKMKKITRSDSALDNCYCVSLNVKKRYVDPLVKNDIGGAYRLSSICPEAKAFIDDFLAFKDSPYGCVPWEE